MSGPSKGNAVEINDKAQLVEFAASGCKPSDKWRIGTEHEKFGFTLDTHEPLSYEGPKGIRAMLEGLQRFGWHPEYEGDNIIALSKEGCSVSLEPGGQLELSGAAVETLHETCAEVHTPQMDPEGNADHAEGALPDHEKIYANARTAWAGYDVPLLHRTGQS
jgi:glutamate--cysteine ligase